MKAMAAGSMLLGAGLGLASAVRCGAWRRRPRTPIPRPGSIRSSATRRYTLDRPITDPKYSENYNNFYEFGSESRSHATPSS